MKNKLYLGTRKGLLEAVRGTNSWEITRLSFIGVQVPMLLPDARDGTIYAAVEHGHFGSKIHASTDGEPLGKSAPARSIRRSRRTIRMSSIR